MTQFFPFKNYQFQMESFESLYFLGLFLKQLNSLYCRYAQKDLVFFFFFLRCLVQDPFVNQSLPLVTEAGKVIGVDVFMANSNNAFAFTEFRISPSTKNIHSFCRKDKICNRHSFTYTTQCFFFFFFRMLSVVYIYLMQDVCFLENTI